LDPQLSVPGLLLVWLGGGNPAVQSPEEGLDPWLSVPGLLLVWLEEGNPAIQSPEGLDPWLSVPRSLLVWPYEATRLSRAPKGWTRGFPSQDYSWFGLIEAIWVSILGYRMDPLLYIPR